MMMMIKRSGRMKLKGLLIDEAPADEIRDLGIWVSDLRIRDLRGKGGGMSGSGSCGW